MMRYYTTICSKKKFFLYRCAKCSLWLVWFASILLWGSGRHVSADEPLPGAVPELPTHLWLARPVDATAASNRPDRFYPYASTGQGQYAVHYGVEFVNPAGTPVLAAAAGTVVVAGTDEDEVWGPQVGYYGRLVIVELARRWVGLPVYVLYGHLSEVWVRRGQMVRPGERLGAVGSSGIAMGPHLHFEVRVGRNDFASTQNPELWLAPLPDHGLIYGRVEDERGLPIEGVLLTVRPVEQPNRHWREAWTYIELAGQDAAWPENWVMGDVPAGRLAGEYLIQARVAGRVYTRRVAVRAGEMTWAVIRQSRSDMPALSSPYRVNVMP